MADDEEFPLQTSFKPSSNTDILDPAFPGEGEGRTQMHDACIEAGIVATPMLRVTHDEIQQAWVEENERHDPLKKKTLQQLDKLEDDLDEDTLESLRRRRIAMLKAQAAQAKFGKVKEIQALDFEEQVSEASKDAIVCMLLYTQGSKACDIMRKVMADLAPRHKNIKFVQLVAEDGLIEGFPVSHCPTVLVYDKGEVKKQFVKLDAFDGAYTTWQVVEWELAELGVVRTDLDEDPRYSREFKMFRKQQALNRGNFVKRRGDSDTDEDERSSDSDW